MVLMHSNKREEIKEAQCGDIIAIVGLKELTSHAICQLLQPMIGRGGPTSGLWMEDTTTGDTLCAVDAPVVLEKMDFPEPVIKAAGGCLGGHQVSCEPTSQKDADKLGEALNKLAAEDPSFRYSRDEERREC
eukprot:Skav221461  [mRNA]  locus=scaffold1700:286236:287161:+ [translate_table: standard]